MYVGGKDRVGGHKYTPLYKKGIKKTQNKSMETTSFHDSFFTEYTEANTC